MSDILKVIETLSKGDIREYVLLYQGEAYEIQHALDALRADLARRDDLIKRLVDMCKTFARYGEVTWMPMADNEPRFMEGLRALMKEVEG